jgi:hypothetical protein
MDKFQINGFDADPTSPGARGGTVFATEVPPEKFTYKKPIKFNNQGRANTGTDPVQFQGYAPKEMTFEFIFDQTGFNAQHVEDVPSILKKIDDVTYKYYGSIHKPKFLTVNWGRFGMVCHLKNKDIEYQMFDQAGNPIRAKVMLHFIEHVNPKTGARSSNNSSPDMSHLKVVRMGDSITQLCDQVYDAPQYYVEIAKLNKITNFRQMLVGEQLLFPPIEK